METLRLVGRVFSGKGEGAEFVNLSWARKQIGEKLGSKPYPGTLNIKLTQSSTKRKQALATGGTEILPTSGYCHGRIFEASIMGIKCAVVVPEVPGYPEDVVEVISSTNLREKFHLDDGNLVKVEVTV